MEMGLPIIGPTERLNLMTKVTEMLAVYFIAGTQDCKEGQLLVVLEEALKDGITCFQYREKGAGSLTDANQRKAMALACQKLCREYNVPFIINDEVDLALAIQADGIHVGQEDQNIQEVLRLFPDKIVGLSCYDEKEVQHANQLAGISYYGIGPVYGTISKADAKPPIGVEKLAQLTELAIKPVVAIGGISVANRKNLISTKIVGVSVISALTTAPNIAAAISKLKEP